MWYYGPPSPENNRLQAFVAGTILLSLIGVFNSNARELKEMLYQWERPFQVDHSKFAARFWGDPTPFEEGIAANVTHHKTLRLLHVEEVAISPTQFFQDLLLQGLGFY